MENSPVKASMAEADALAARRHHHRFLLPHSHLELVFGGDWFALKAEAFARFFGTPVFLIGQTLVVAIWILVNVLGYQTFDAYPFILLNLAFSLQAAYAAPLILLAQTRQADRDKAHATADAEHVEELHRISEDRQTFAAAQTALLLQMMEQNTKLTEMTRMLTAGGDLDPGGSQEHLRQKLGAVDTWTLVTPDVLRQQPRLDQKIESGTVL